MIRIAFFCSFAVSFVACAAIADDWPKWRGADRSGVSNETDWASADWPKDGPAILWRASVGTGFSSIVVADGRLLTLGNQDDVDTLHCLDAGTGESKWTFEYPAPLDDRYFEGGPTSTPTIDGDRVYILSRAGDLACLETASGKTVWTKSLPSDHGVEIPGWGFAGSPVVIDKHLYLSVGQSGMKLDKATGEVVWQSEGEAGYMTPLMIDVDGRAVLVVASGKFYQGVDPESGDVLWRKRWLTNFGCNAADPIFFDRRLFISSGYNRGSTLLDLGVETPEAIWETKDFQNQWSSSVLMEGFLYGVDGNDTGDRFLKCLDARSGEVKWSETGYGSASLIAAAGQLIVLSDSGELVVAPASSEKFVPTARAKILTGKCWTMPVLSRALLYARNAVGDLVCVDLRKK